MDFLATSPSQMPLPAVGVCPMDMSADPDYYKYGSDNSVGCWATNYLLSAAIVVYIVYLVMNKRAPLDLEHTRVFIVGKYAMTGISVLVAATVHQGLFARAGDVTVEPNHFLWAIVLATLMCAGGFTTDAAWSMLTQYDNTTRNALVYLSVCVGGIILSVWVVLLPDGFTESGIFGEFLPDIALMGAIIAGTWCGCGGGQRLTEGSIISLVGIVVIFGGAGIQVSLGGVCGIPCPLKCPLPAPAFNHNALFHVIQLAGMGVLAFGMNSMCTSLELGALANNARKGLGGMMVME